MTAEQRGELLQLLVQHNLDALERLAALEPALRRALGPQFRRLTRAMDDLDFAAAHQILEGLPA